MGVHRSDLIIEPATCDWSITTCHLVQLEMLAKRKVLSGSVRTYVNIVRDLHSCLQNAYTLQDYRALLPAMLSHVEVWLRSRSVAVVRVLTHASTAYVMQGISFCHTDFRQQQVLSSATDPSVAPHLRPHFCHVSQDLLISS